MSETLHPKAQTPNLRRERDFFVENLLGRVHYIIKMIWWTGLAPWVFKFPFTGSLTSTFLKRGASDERK